MKNFEQLKNEELKIVFEKNKKLQEIVSEAAQEDACFWIDEYLNCFDRGAIDYNIGYPGNYMIILDQEKFIDGLEQIQKNYEYLTEEAQKDLTYSRHLINRLDNLSRYDDINEARLINRIDGILEDLKDEFLNKLINEYNYYYDGENLKNYFLEFYAENMNDNYYIDENYILYQHIEYGKCYA